MITPNSGHTVIDASLRRLQMQEIELTEREATLATIQGSYERQALENELYRQRTAIDEERFRLDQLRQRIESTPAIEVRG